MENNNLPQEELKMYGIIDSDNTFTKKLSAEEIQKFLQGDSIIADNDKNRIIFQLKDNNSRLDVKLYERDKDISELLEESKKQIQYSDAYSKYDVNEEKTMAQLNFTKSAFVFDKDTNTVRELDFIKNSEILTKLVAEKKDVVENGRYKNELLKLKEFLQEKIDLYPEIAKEISNDLNIVSNAINSVNSISADEKQMKNENKSDIQLNVNDPDMYQDANEAREYDDEQEDLERDRPKGRGR